jgi:multidrug efflux pump subunit AcrB
MPHPGSAAAKASPRWNSWPARELPDNHGSRMDRTRVSRNAPPAAPALLLFAGSVAFVFLVLAALYESWTLPLAVILVVPMCVLCSLAGVAMARNGYQHLHTGRLRRTHRTGLQKRHPDCRIRQTATR